MKTPARQRPQHTDDWTGVSPLTAATGSASESPQIYRVPSDHGSDKVHSRSHPSDDCLGVDLLPERTTRPSWADAPPPPPPPRKAPFLRNTQRPPPISPPRAGMSRGSYPSIDPSPTYETDSFQEDPMWCDLMWCCDRSQANVVVLHSFPPSKPPPGESQSSTLPRLPFRQSSRAPRISGVSAIVLLQKNVRGYHVRQISKDPDAEKARLWRKLRRRRLSRRQIEGPRVQRERQQRALRLYAACVIQGHWRQRKVYHVSRRPAPIQFPTIADVEPLSPPRVSSKGDYIEELLGENPTTPTLDLVKHALRRQRAREVISSARRRRSADYHTSDTTLPVLIRRSRSMDLVPAPLDPNQWSWGEVSSSAVPDQNESSFLDSTILSWADVSSCGAPKALESTQTSLLAKPPESDNIQRDGSGIDQEKRPELDSSSPDISSIESPGRGLKTFLELDQSPIASTGSLAMDDSSLCAQSLSIESEHGPVELECGEALVESGSSLKQSIDALVDDVVEPSLEAGLEQSLNPPVDVSLESGLEQSLDAPVEASLEAGLEQSLNTPVEAPVELSRDPGNKHSPEPVLEQSHDEPGANEPAIEAPVIQAPAIKASAIKASAIEATAIEATAIEATAIETPAIEAPAIEEAPVEEAPVEEAQEPRFEKSAEVPAVEGQTAEGQTAEGLVESCESSVEGSVESGLVQAQFGGGSVESGSVQSSEGSTFEASVESGSVIVESDESGVYRRTEHYADEAVSTNSDSRSASGYEAENSHSTVTSVDLFESDATPPEMAMDVGEPSESECSPKGDLGINDEFSREGDEGEEDDRSPESRSSYLPTAMRSISTSSESFARSFVVAAPNAKTSSPMKGTGERNLVRPGTPVRAAPSDGSSRDPDLEPGRARNAGHSWDSSKALNSTDSQMVHRVESKTKVPATRQLYGQTLAMLARYSPHGSTSGRTGRLYVDAGDSSATDVGSRDVTPRRRGNSTTKKVQGILRTMRDRNDLPSPLHVNDEYERPIAGPGQAGRSPEIKMKKGDAVLLQRVLDKVPKQSSLPDQRGRRERNRDNAQPIQGGDGGISVDSFDQGCSVKRTATRELVMGFLKKIPKLATPSSPDRKSLVKSNLLSKSVNHATIDEQQQNRVRTPLRVLNIGSGSVRRGDRQAMSSKTGLRRRARLRFLRGEVTSRYLGQADVAHFINGFLGVNGNHCLGPMRHRLNETPSVEEVTPGESPRAQTSWPAPDTSYIHRTQPLALKELSPKSGRSYLPPSLESSPVRGTRLFPVLDHTAESISPNSSSLEYVSGSRRTSSGGMSGSRRSSNGSSGRRRSSGASSKSRATSLRRPLHWPNKARRDSLLGRNEIELRKNTLEEIGNDRKAQEVVTSTKAVERRDVSSTETSSIDMAERKGDDSKDTSSPAAEVLPERPIHLLLLVGLVTWSLVYVTMQMHRIKWQDLFQLIQRVSGQSDNPFQRRIETKEPTIAPDLQPSRTNKVTDETQMPARYMDELSIGPHLPTVDELGIGP